MANRNSFIAIPQNLDDTLVLRRFLTKLVEQLDIAFSHRGEEGFASNITLISTAKSLEEVVQDINQLGNTFVKLDSSNLTEELVYTTQPTQTTLGLVTKKYVDELYVPQTSPTLINSASADADIKANADKLDELINVLKLSGILV